MAEGWARHLGPDWLNAMSAGIEAHGKNPRAIEVMRESGVDISNQTSRKLTDEMLDSADRLITVCSHADQHCPAGAKGKQMEHWDLEDPAKATGTEAEIATVFTSSCSEIRQRVADLIRRLEDERNAAH